MMGSRSGAGDLILDSSTRPMAYLIGGTILLSAACGYPLLPTDDTPDEPLPSRAGAEVRDA
jgi:sorbitol-specific phosphotransferase system component IIBC